MSETHTPAEQVPCPFCESPISATARKCRYCAEWVARNCEGCGTPIRDDWAARGLCAECQKKPTVSERPEVARPLEKSRTTAGIFALLLGGLGAHKFYLGKTGMGLVYLILFWTFIPALLGLVEGVVYLNMSDEDFARKHG